MTFSGSYPLPEESETGVAGLVTATKAELRLTLSGTSTNTDAGDPADDHSRAFHQPLGHIDLVLLGWRGDEELTADLNLGGPVGGGAGN